jgi:16S rRNA (adenine1518-N6/adenine1519-N6)-dimethyltransferase
MAQGLGMSRTEVLPLLEKAGIEPIRRAEALSLEEWARLWVVFTEAGRGHADN